MYRKELYLYDKSNQLHHAVIRNYTPDDFTEMIDIQRECFPPPYPSELWWNEKQLHNHVRLFPEGAICVEINHQLVASMTGLMVQLASADAKHSWAEITDNGYLTTHDPNGNTLYIADISVRPSSRQLGLGKWMMNAMYELVVYKGLTRLLGGGRMSGYHLVQHEMSAEEYFAEVIRGERRDPVISFLLRCGRTPVGVVADYLDDEESCNYAGLMEWKNPFL